MSDVTLPVAPVAALYDYFEASLRPDSAQERPVIERDAAQDTRLLSNVERATARITVASLPSQHDAFSDLHEAATRLAVLDARGLLSRLSGHAVAQNLHRLFFSTHPRALVNAAKGWHMLELLDRRDLAEVWIGTPDPADPRHLTRVRLRDRMTSIRAESKCAHLQTDRLKRPGPRPQ